MNILFISKHKWPHIGGVEKHIKCLSEELVKNGLKLKTISEEDIKYPKVKVLGLLYIWYWFLKNIKIILNSDIVHIHDVFIWYLPFRFIFLNKKVFLTFHGWEGKYPIPIYNILNKRLAKYLSNGNISVGNYINKYYGIKSDYVIYGGVDQKLKPTHKKIKNSIVYLGRQDSDTGINEFKKWLKKQKVKYLVNYVTNKRNPEKYLKTAEYCVPSGYLSFLEAKSYGCKILTFSNNPLKVDYWKEIKNLKSVPSWSDVSNIYLKLWKRI